MQAPKTLSLTSKLVKRWLPERPVRAHKGQFGHVLLVAGSRGMSGAAVLAAEAATRIGAGYVTVAAPRSQQSIFTCRWPEALTWALPETREGCIHSSAAGWIAEKIRKGSYQVLAVGPGLSTHPETCKALLRLLELTPQIPVILDADGINILARFPRRRIDRMLRLRSMPLLLTPHPGEMARLWGVSARDVEAQRERWVREGALKFGGVCVLKGRGTLVSDGAAVYKNPTGSSAMAKAGSGDVLTGIVSGLAAQSFVRDPGKRVAEALFLAACLGVYLHGRSGDLARRRLSPWSVSAQDLIRYLPQAIKSL